MTIDQFTKSSSPVTVIVNVANPVAIKLIKILLEQGSRLLIVDKLTHAKRALLGDILTRSDCLFMDSESTFKNIEKFKKIDYVYYFLSQLATGSTYPEIYPENMEILRLDHKEFLKESNRIDAYLKLAVAFEASFTLVTSAYVSQFLEPIPESNLQIQRYAESLVQDFVEKNNANARVVRIGELIGRDSDIASPTYIARLIREVILRTKINVFGDGMQQNYLVHTEDAVYAVLKAAFSSESKGRIYLASYAHPFTSLSIAYQLLELTIEEKEVIFNEVLPEHEKVTKTKDMCLAPSLAALGWEPQIQLEQALAETATVMAQQLNRSWTPVRGESLLQQESPEGTVSSPSKRSLLQNSEGIVANIYQQLVVKPTLSLLALVKPTKVSSSPVAKEKRMKRLSAYIVTLVLLVLATPYIHFGVTAYKLYAVAKQAKGDVAALDSDRFGNYAKQLPSLVDGLTADYKAVWYLKYLPVIGEWYLSSADLLYGGKSLAESAATSLKALAPAVKIVKGLASVSPNNPAGTVSRDYYSEIGEIMAEESSFTQSVQNAKIGNSRIQRVKPSVFPSFVEKQLTEVKSFVADYTAMVEEVSKTYDLIPYLLGYKERRNYFVLLQNETEIRATGGWFTNYAQLGVENGQVRQLVVNDVYDLDGKIAGIAAPKEMQTALGVKNIKASLSNWNPELAGTSKVVAELLAQSGQVKPNDVTITMTFQVIKDLLTVLGTIKVEGIGEVTAANLYEKVGVLHAQFIPGSQEKTKVVSQFMPKLLDSIAQAPLAQKQEVLKVFSGALKQRSIMIYSDNVELKEKVLSAYDTYRVIEQKDNPLFVVDWNWGGNKANRFIKRSVDVIVNEPAKKLTLTMLYTNESKSDSYPEGTYDNFQRVYFPSSLTYAQSSGYVGKPTQYASDKNVPYVLAEMKVGKQESKPITLEFNMTEVPPFLNLLKQSGYDIETVRVIVTRSADSKIDEALLTEQGFTKVDTKLVKTYVRKEDIRVTFSD